MPDEPEVRGLLALMLLHDARREARFAGGELVLLEDQDRSRWNRGQIAEGRAQLDQAIALQGRGPYVLQAAIASLQAGDPIDWAEVAALYGELARVTGSPVVELNRAVAVAEVGGAGGGARDRRCARAGRLPVPALDPRRPAATPRPHRRGARRVRARARARAQRARAALPRGRIEAL